MIFGINTTRNISKLFQLYITISKYHSWCLCQLSLQIMLHCITYTNHSFLIVHSKQKLTLLVVPGLLHILTLITSFYLVFITFVRTHPNLVVLWHYGRNLELSRATVNYPPLLIISGTPKRGNWTPFDSILFPKVFHEWQTQIRNQWLPLVNTNIILFSLSLCSVLEHILAFWTLERFEITGWPKDDCLSVYIINTVPNGKCFVPYLSTRYFYIRNLTCSLRPLLRFFIRQQLVHKYRMHVIF